MTGERWCRILVTVFLFASVAEFVVRGPVRLLRDGVGWNDFLSPYIQAKAWAHAQDPYSTRSLISNWPADNNRPTWVDTEAANGILEREKGIPSPYPLPSLVILSPLAALSWPDALYLWMALSVAAVMMAAFALISICGGRLGDLRSQLFLAFLFGLAPLHTGLATANPAMLAVSLTAGTHWAARNRREKTAGILLAIAICLKPTVAGGLLLYYLIHQRWKIAAITCGVAASITGVGVTRLALAGVSWIPSYAENTKRIFAVGSVDDFTLGNSLRFNMINAQVFFAGVIKNASVENLLSLLLGAALLGCWLWLCYRSGSHSAVLEISAISVLSLIAVYHRFYDAVLLMWPLAWSILRARRRAHSVAILVMIVPFLVPGPVLLSELAHAGRIPFVITNAWWWNAIVMPHEVWDLVVLAVLLLYFASRGRSEQPEEVLQETVLPPTKQAPALG